MDSISPFWDWARLHFAGCVFTFLSYIVVFSLTHWKQFFEKI